MESPDLSPNISQQQEAAGLEFNTFHNSEIENGNTEHTTSYLINASNESDDSINGFVKLEHPSDLSGVEFGTGQRFGIQSEVTPSDEVSPLSPEVDEQMTSPSGQFGNDGGFGMKPAEDSPADSGRDVVGDLMGFERESGKSSPLGGGVDMRSSSPDERTYDREGPLVFGGIQDEDFGGAPSIKPDIMRAKPYENYSEPLKSSTDFGFIEENKPQLSLFQSAFVGSGPWFEFKSIDPRVLDLIYWRDPKKSGIALGATLAILLCFQLFSVISVAAYSGLALLTLTLAFRAYKYAMAKWTKTDTVNPFKPYLEKDLQLPPARVHQQVDVLLEHGQLVARHLRRLFLVEDLFSTVKFGLVLWTLTYIGSWFSGITLVILTVIGMFTIPKFYEVYKAPIDKNVAVVQEHVKKATDVAQQKLPFLKKKQT